MNLQGIEIDISKKANVGSVTFMVLATEEGKAWQFLVLTKHIDPTNGISFPFRALIFPYYAIAAEAYDKAREELEQE